MGNLARRLEKLEAVKAEALEIQVRLTREWRSWQAAAREYGVTEAEVIAEAEQMVSQYDKGLTPPGMEHWRKLCGSVSVDRLMDEARLLIRDWKAQHEQPHQAD